MAMMPLEDGLLVSNHLRVEEACEVRPPLTAEESSHYIFVYGNRRHVRELPQDQASGER